MTKKRLSKRTQLKLDTWDQTQQCYERAKTRAEAEFTPHTDDMLPSDLESLLDRRAKLAARITELYLEELNKLPSEVLENILSLHKGGLTKRRGDTLESIRDELTRRSLLDDSNENSNQNK